MSPSLSWVANKLPFQLSLESKSKLNRNQTSIKFQTCQTILLQTNMPNYQEQQFYVYKRVKFQEYKQQFHDKQFYEQ